MTGHTHSDLMATPQPTRLSPGQRDTTVAFESLLKKNCDIFLLCRVKGTMCVHVCACCTPAWACGCCFGFPRAVAFARCRLLHQQHAERSCPLPGTARKTNGTTAHLLDFTAASANVFAGYSQPPDATRRASIAGSLMDDDMQVPRNLSSAIREILIAASSPCV